ncbi:MAG: hypothetical protein K9L30_14410 [Desulfobacterales bacterium]|nr:hypothetical protein [Desulfobacterales bacterium]
MANNILIAFDESENAMRSVIFVAGHFTHDASVTLYSVLQDTETMCAMNSPELTPYFTAKQHSFCNLVGKNTNSSKKRSRQPGIVSSQRVLPQRD